MVQGVFEGLANWTMQLARKQGISLEGSVPDVSPEEALKREREAAGKERDAQWRATRQQQEVRGKLDDLDAVRGHLVAWTEKKLKSFTFVEPTEKIARLPEHAEWEAAPEEAKAEAKAKLDEATKSLIETETALQQTEYLNNLRPKVDQELLGLNKKHPGQVERLYAGVVAQVVKDAAELVRVTRSSELKEKFKTEHAAWEAGDRSKPEPKEPIIVKISIGGSGDAGWRTNCDISGAYAKADSGMGEERSRELYYTDPDTGEVIRDRSNASIHHRRLDESKFSFDYAGPGAPNTYGLGYVGGGTSDTGSNSIWNLAENVPEDITPEISKALNTALHLAQADVDAQSEESAVDVKKAINETLAKADSKQQLVVLIKGHSRGAVAAAHVAKRLKEYFPSASVELTQVDPVPGPAQFPSNKTVDVGELDETTVVYSVFSGHGFHFTSEKVLNAKRIIISAQAHGVGIQNGFKIGNKRYKGAALNSLDPGVYRDDNADISVVGELVKIADPDHFKKAFVEVYEQRYGRGTGGKAGANYDSGRQANIEAALAGIQKLDPAKLAAVMNETVKTVDKA